MYYHHAFALLTAQDTKYKTRQCFQATSQPKSDSVMQSEASLKNLSVTAEKRRRLEIGIGRLTGRKSVLLTGSCSRATKY